MTPARAVCPLAGVTSSDEESPAALNTSCSRSRHCLFLGAHELCSLENGAGVRWGAMALPTSTIPIPNLKATPGLLCYDN